MKTLLLSMFLLIGTYLSNDRFVNTNWVSKVADRYTDSFNFKANQYVIHYNSLADQTYFGCYSVSKDTLIIKERVNSQSKKAVYLRIKFLLKDHVLYPCSHEELVAHQWKKSEVRLDKTYIFKRI